MVLALRQIYFILFMSKIYYQFYNYNSTIMPGIKKVKATVIPDSESESDSSVPIVQQKKSKKQQVETKKAVKKVVQKAESSDQESSPEQKPVKQVKTDKGAKKVVAKKVSSSEEESSEEKPKKVVKSKSPLQKAVVSKKKPAKVSSSEEESSEEAPKKVVKAKSPVQKAVVAKRKAKISSDEEESEKPTPKVKAAKKASPALKPQVKKIVKKVSESEESSEESEQVPVAKKGKATKSPLQKAKSPVQKPLGKAKKVVEPVEDSDEEEEESEVKPVKKQNQKQKVEEKMVDQDEEGEFEVCVKGLSFQAYEDDVRALFAQCGEVLSCKLLMRPDGKPKGLAFVKFGKKSAFNKAMELDSTEQFGRNINVEQAQGKQGGNSFNKAPGAGGFNKFGSQEPANITTPTLFIGGLSYNSSVESITEYFQSIGDVVRARIVTDRETGKPRGFGYVEFNDVTIAKKAYDSLNGGYLDGRAIRLDSASERQPPTGGFGGGQGGQGGYGGGQGGQGGFGGGRGAPRNAGNSRVDLSQDDKMAKKGAMGTFQGKKMTF